MTPERDKQLEELISNHYKKTGVKVSIPIPEACCFDRECDRCHGNGFAFGSFSCEVSQ